MPKSRLAEGPWYFAADFACIRLFPLFLGGLFQRIVSSIFRKMVCRAWHKISRQCRRLEVRQALHIPIKPFIEKDYTPILLIAFRLTARKSYGKQEKEKREQNKFYSLTITYNKALL